ncbi:phosphate ABC transporter substrate-binding protein [Pseudoalteromonas sp. NBT06-2]|uniref:phosphate ABC transporter substrate-binding protein n=1 Tax=Pseudoalteromonas sp. NBT06-2 TaxID=2025950 RepID=UPI000BA6D0F1|nr:phosphate ABC transporter substrate-binding protein [Pseudoalteromonas sp. NBT06-2]PAJ75612.1 phosphate ABC transporter substrate-binding protein [Pseudoalteromonas sp. NBT06-2]
MKTRTLAMTLFLFSATTLADVAVIVHPSNSNAIDATVIKKIFTGKSKSFSDGSKVSPVSQSASSVVAAEFNKKALKKSSSQLKAYWSKLVFTGKGTPPKELSNDADVLKHIASTPNAIGFISVDSVDSSVKVVQKY